MIKVTKWNGINLKTKPDQVSLTIQDRLEASDTNVAPTRRLMLRMNPNR